MRTQTTSSETVEMYLKTIAELGDGRSPVIIARVAERLGVSPVSANEMMKRLVAQGFLVHERYKGVVLTENGRYIAHNIMRRQRLWECFLVDHLKFDWAGVYEMACRLEHATSNVLAESLAVYLGNPPCCPHGNPIPQSDGGLAEITAQPLSSLRVGAAGYIHSIQPTTTDVYAYLNRHQILPRRPFTLVEIAPMEGPYTLQLETNRVALGRSLAELIWVSD